MPRRRSPINALVPSTPPISPGSAKGAQEHGRDDAIGHADGAVDRLRREADRYQLDEVRGHAGLRR